MVTVTQQEFLRVLWGAGPGIAELDTLDAQKKFNAFPFTYPASLDSLVDAAGRHNKKGANVYMGVCLRREMWPRLSGRVNAKTGKSETEHRGTEANALSAGAVWVEIDFTGLGHKGRVVEAEDARKRLAEFGRKPSIVVRSGGGIHVYWLLKEPVTGGAIWNVKAVNQELAAHFGADNASDLARILRLPGLVNPKYDPPRPVEISWWHPEHRYTLADFGQPAAAAPAPADPAPATTTPAAPGEKTPPALQASRAMPSIDLPEESCRKIGQMLSEIWFPGWRHQMSLDVAGMLAHSGVSLASAKAIISTASTKVGGDTEDRLKAVEATYDRFAFGHEIAGATVLEKAIDENFPALARDKAKKIVLAIRKLLPKRVSSDGPDGQPDFVVVRVVKFDSRPARYQILIEKNGDQHEVVCETAVFDEFRLFRRAFFEATHNKRIHITGKAKQSVWEHLTETADLEVKTAPREASTSGAIESELEEFLDSKKENPEVGTLRSFAGYTEHDTFFRLAAFRGHLKDRGLKLSDREIAHVLKLSGWKDEQRRMGEKNPRLWIKASNGHLVIEKPDLFLAPKSTNSTREP